MNHRTIRQFHHSLFLGLQQRLIFTNNNNYATITITTAGNRHFSSLNNNNNNNNDDVKQKHLSLRLYRVLQRYIRDDIISSSNNNYNTMLLQPPLDPRQLGQAQILSIPSSDNDKETTKNKSDYILQFFLTQSSKDYNNNDDHSSTDSSIWVNTTVLKDTLRQVFKNTYNDNNDPLGQQHQKAIDAIRTWKEQIHMWNHCTTVTNNENYGIRVIATSRYVYNNIHASSIFTHIVYHFHLNSFVSPSVLCHVLYRYIGTTRSNANNKINENLSHHFSYKIRIQCLRYPIPNDENMVVQLLGRTWYIQEEEEKKSPTFPFSTKDDDDDDEIIKLSKDVVSIDAPTTGAGKKFIFMYLDTYHT